MEQLWTPWRYGYITGTDKKDTRTGVPAALTAWPGDLGCLFCNMIAAADYAIAQGMGRDEAEGAAYIVERGRTGFLVLNAFPYNNGHLMAVPYRHESSLAALPLEEAEELMRLTRRAETALRTVYRPDGLNAGLNLGETAGAGIAAHMHIHMLPRWKGDTNFMTVVGETRVLPEMLTDTWKRLRGALAEIPGETGAA